MAGANVDLTPRLRELAAEFKQDLVRVVGQKKLQDKGGLLRSIEVNVQPISGGWEVVVYFKAYGRIIENIAYRKGRIKYKNESLIHKRPARYKWFKRPLLRGFNYVIEDLAANAADQIVDKWLRIIEIENNE